MTLSFVACVDACPWRLEAVQVYVPVSELPTGSMIMVPFVYTRILPESDPNSWPSKYRLLIWFLLYIANMYHTQSSFVIYVLFFYLFFHKGSEKHCFTEGDKLWFICTEQHKIRNKIFYVSNFLPLPFWFFFNMKKLIFGYRKLFFK